MGLGTLNIENLLNWNRLACDMSSVSFFLKIVQNFASRWTENPSIRAALQGSVVGGSVVATWQWACYCIDELICLICLLVKLKSFCIGLGLFFLVPAIDRSANVKQSLSHSTDSQLG